jgi:putative ABC transport system permease protein
VKILEVKNINKAYKLSDGEKVGVLHGINASFHPGEIVSILGESGCGKTSLLNIIGGMDTDYEGEVMVQGKNLKEMTEKEIDDYRRTKLGFVFQSFHLISHLSVLDNVMIAMQMSNMDKKERINRAQELLAEVGLKDHMNKRPTQLSGGQKQRVAIARALSNNPDIILADEPTGALDQETSKQILKLLEDIAKKGILIITVTHSKKVSDSGTRILKMEDGKIKDDIHLKESYEGKSTQKEQKSHKNLSLISSFMLAFKNMKLNAKRNLLVSLGGSIGILSVVLMLSLGNGVTTFINDEINSSTNPLMIDVKKPAKDDNAKQNRPGPPQLRIGEPINQDELEKIKAVKHISSTEKATALQSKSSMTMKEKSANIPQLSTISKSFDQDILIKGKLPAENEIILTQDMAKAISSKKNDKSVIGKKVAFYINDMKENKPITLEKELIVSGVYEQQNTGPIEGPNAYITYSTLEELYNDNGMILSPTQINVFAEQKADVDGIKAKMENLGYKTSQTSELLKTLTTYLKMATMVLSGIAGTALIVSGIMILVVLYISVVERTKEIGILRAVGARKKDIKRIFFAESALLGLFSGLIAVIGATAISMILNTIFSTIFDVKLINVTGYYVGFGMMASTVISIVAGLLPSAKAAKLDPIESLRFE